MSDSTLRPTRPAAASADRLELPTSLSGLAERAAAVLPAGAHAYYAGGAGRETTLDEAGPAWGRYALRPRVLVDVSRVDTAVEVLASTLQWPVAVAPMAYQVGAHSDGEVGLARAATATGAGYVLSTSASTSVPDLAAQVPDAVRWFQLYLRGGLSGGIEMISQAALHGYSAVLLTVDLPVLGIRDRERQHPWDPSPGLSTVAAGGQPLAALDWDGLATLVQASPVPLLVKGVLDPRDAVLAADAGAAGVVVSTHGGRQLDGVLPTAMVLPDVVDALAGRVPVLVDGGITRGTDVVTALALGATACLVGRLALWGLAVGGGAGARRVLELLREEVETTLALLGVPRVADLNREHVIAAPWR